MPTAQRTQQPPQVDAVHESLPVLEVPLSKQRYMNAFLLDIACQRYFSCSNLLWVTNGPLQYLGIIAP